MVRKKINILVLMGGKSPEFNVSVASGIQIVKKLSKSRYEIIPVVISPNGKVWHLTTPHPLLSIPNPLDPKVLPDDLIPSIGKTISGIEGVKTHIDIALIAMHGPYGENGAIQGLLEITGIKYTGSNILASSIGMDKQIFRQLMIQNKINVPKYVSLKRGESKSKVSKTLGKPPYFVKPVNQGSSVGCSLVLKKKDLKKAINFAFKYSEVILVDEYIKGKELTVAVIGGKKPKALPIIEVVHTKEFFDYESKYQDSETIEIVPAIIDKTISKKVCEVALKIFKLLDCRGVARVDFLLKGKKLFVLEINTIPGMTENSLVPKSAKAAGLSYSKLLDTIIKDATR